MIDVRHMLLAWGLLISIVATVAATVWLPLMDMAKNNHNRIVSLEERIAKTRTLATLQGNLKTSLETIKQSIGADHTNQFFVARSTTLGAADLQRRIQETIVAKRGRQISSQPLVAKQVADFYKLQVTVNLSGNLKSIQEILFELESGQPRIFIEQLLVAGSSAGRSRRLRARNRQNLKRNLTVNEEQLTVRITASAYMQNGDESDSRFTSR